MGPKSKQKSISTLKAENQLNASRLAFSWFSGVEVRVKKRRQDRPRQAKADQDKTRQDFYWIFEAKLGLEKGAKTGRDRPRQAKTGQDMPRQDKTG